MYGIRAGPLVSAVMTVVFLLYGGLFFAQGRPVSGTAVLLAAGLFGAYVYLALTRAAAMRKERALERERAFVERVRRG